MRASMRASMRARNRCIPQAASWGGKVGRARGSRVAGIVLLSLVAWLMVGLVGAPDVAGSRRLRADPPGSSAGWQLIFNDDFQGTALDGSKWVPCYWWATSGGCTNSGNHELEWYASGNAFLANGLLRLSARKQTVQGSVGKTYQYTSGMASTDGRFSFRYGYVEARFRVPQGKGLWPAFWAVPADHTWYPELDMMEIVDHDPSTIYMTVHYYDSKGNLASDSTWWTGPNFSTAFHTIGVDWEPSGITWYVDGVARKQVTDPTRIPTTPLELICNLAVGGAWPGAPNASTPFPSYFDLDYVRVWQQSDGSAAGGTPTPPMATATTPPASPATALAATPTSTSGTPVAANGQFGVGPPSAPGGGTGGAQPAAPASPRGASYPPLWLMATGSLVLLGSVGLLCLVYGRRRSRDDFGRPIVSGDALALRAHGGPRADHRPLFATDDIHGHSSRPMYPVRGASRGMREERRTAPASARRARVSDGPLPWGSAASTGQGWVRHSNHSSIVPPVRGARPEENQTTWVSERTGSGAGPRVPQYSRRVTARRALQQRPENREDMRDRGGRRR